MYHLATMHSITDNTKTPIDDRERSTIGWKLFQLYFIATISLPGWKIIKQNRLSKNVATKEPETHRFYTSWSVHFQTLNEKCITQGDKRSQIKINAQSSVHFKL